MSLILEALNRSRREQQNAAPVPGVDSEHYSPPAADNAWRQRGMLVALVLALLVIALLLGREFARDGTEPPTAAAALPAPVAQSQAPPSALSPAAPTSPAVVDTPVAQQAQDTPAAEAPPEPAVELPAPAVPASAPQRAPSAITAGGTAAEVAALYQQAGVPAAPAQRPTAAVAEPAPVTTEDTVDIASLASAAEQALEDMRLAEHAAPFLGELSQQRKDAVPTLMYLQHDYRVEGGSTVTINGQQAGAGQTVGRGVKVEDILPDSVVLSHDGQQFRLRALNSWVNL